MSLISPYYRTIAQLLQSRSFSIDEYQREYKWDRENIEELISDLQNAFEVSYRDGDPPKVVSSYSPYFLGSIIIANRGGKSYLVDGQQRITSLTLLLIYLYHKAMTAGLPVTSTIEPLIFSDNYGERDFNLNITERLPVLRALFSAEEYNADGKEESVRTIVDRYRDIEELDIATELGDGLANFIYWLINNVGLIEIATDNDSHAYAIFETMNDRGKPLSPVDMLKAHLLAPIDKNEDRATADRIWKQTVLDLISWGGEADAERDAACIKAWLRAKYAETIRDRKAGATDRDWELIGTTFHRWIRDNHARTGSGGAMSNLRLMTDEFPFFARAYRMILDASRTYTPGLEAVFFNAHNDFTWQSTILLAPLNLGDDDETVRMKLAATATYLDIWLMRRVINYIRVGYSNVSYAMWLLCREIRSKPLDDLVDTLAARLDNDGVNFDGSKSPQRYGITALRLNQFTRRYIFHLLARVTSYVERGAGRPDIFDKYIDRDIKNPWDVEHIWPDAFERYTDECQDIQEFDEWRDNIGGLLLLPADVNRSLQDMAFEEKRGTTQSRTSLRPASPRRYTNINHSSRHLSPGNSYRSSPMNTSAPQSRRSGANLSGCSPRRSGRHGGCTTTAGEVRPTALKYQPAASHLLPFTRCECRNRTLRAARILVAEVPSTRSRLGSAPGRALPEPRSVRGSRLRSGRAPSPPLTCGSTRLNAVGRRSSSASVSARSTRTS